MEPGECSVGDGPNAMQIGEGTRQSGKLLFKQPGQSIFQATKYVCRTYCCACGL